MQTGTAQFGYLKVAHVTITSTGVASSDFEGVAASRRSGTPNPHDLWFVGESPALAANLQ
jgi:hypothetical protein